MGRLFARVYPRIAATAARRGATEHRERLLAGLSGDVVEVGVGHGPNLAHYPASVTSVLAVEPDPDLRAAAERSAVAAPVPVRVVAGTAESIPAEHASLDAAVVSLVLCSVDDQAAALAEIRRVLRPGGELRFYEHVRSDRRGLALVQRALARPTRRLAGGCRPDRDTLGAIRAAGFRVTDCRSFDFRPTPLAVPWSPHVAGAAVRD